jgi:hypothetical protein
MNEAKPLSVPFYLRADVERIITGLSEMRHELESENIIDFTGADRRKLLIQVKRDLRFYLALARRRRL